MRRKYGIDALWNLASLAFVAIAGVVLNIVVGRYYGPEMLGRLNFVIAIYILLSQFCVWGQHYAVLQRIAVASTDNTADRYTFGKILTPALIITFVASVAIVILAGLATLLLAHNFIGNDIKNIYLFIYPGLIFYSINKVLLNFLCAIKYFRLFSICQATRYMLLIVIVIIWPLFNLSGNTITLAFTLSETMLCPLIWSFVQPHASLGLYPGFRDQLNDVRTFGQRGLLSGAVSEINTKLDIVILGMFTSEQTVGIYSVAALIFEGLSQFPMVLRNLVNPKLAVLIATGDAIGLGMIIRKIRVLSFSLVALAGVLSVLFYPLFIEVVLVLPAYQQALPALIVLTAGLLIAAPYLPFDMILNQGGRPGLQSWQKIIATLLNLIINLMLAPFFGMLGTAFGTALAMILSVISLRYIVRRHLKVAI